MNGINPDILEASEDLTEKLGEILGESLLVTSQRMRVSALACSVALEHSIACRALLTIGMVPSALVVHRVQYEAVVRSVWAFYAATDAHVAKLASTLDVEAEQAAKNLPSVAEMMERLSSKAPQHAYQTLVNFKDNSWKALNSFVHAGIHALQRQESGYPPQLIEQILRHCNGLAVVAGMQAAMLTNDQRIARQVSALQTSHAECLPLQ